MKAISLWNPWACLMAVKAKRIETRSWATLYRGPLAICSTKNGNGADRLYFGLIQAELRGHYGRPGQEITMSDLPNGFVLCVVDLVDCIEVERLVPKISPAEYEFGDYSAGRFGWVTENLRKLKAPVPVIGRQGLFDLPKGMQAAVEMGLP